MRTKNVADLDESGWGNLIAFASPSKNDRHLVQIRPIIRTLNLEPFDQLQKRAFRISQLFDIFLIIMKSLLGVSRSPPLIAHHIPATELSASFIAQIDDATIA
jgi:hypothetical protein